MMSRRGRARTDDLFRVREALSQLSYAPSLLFVRSPEQGRLPQQEFGSPHHRKPLI